ncbi:MAG TPA: hypothetical protein VIW22_06775, partial [Nitrososphaerales archaeon]
MADVALNLVALGVSLFAFYRAIAFGRVLVGGTYKRRANWTAVFLLAVLFFFLNNSGFIPYLSFGGGGPGILVVTVALVLFVDSSI